MESLNSRLKWLRIDRKMSQTEWANALEVAQSQVARWEKSGKGEPDVASLRKLGRKLGMTLAAIVGDEAPAYAAPRPPTPEEMALAVFDALGIKGPKAEGIGLLLRLSGDDLEDALIALRKISSPIGEGASGTGNKGKAPAG